MWILLQILFFVVGISAFDDRLSDVKSIQYQQRLDREKSGYMRLRQLSQLLIDEIIEESNFLPSKPGLTPSKEVYALRDLFVSTRGSSWVNKNGWNKGDPCTDSWYGVTCKNNHVVALSIVYNQLDGDIRESFCDLTELAGFTAYDNQITSLPSCLSQMNNLQVLDLSSNRLQSLPQIYNMPSLSKVSLYLNEISGSLPSFSGCTNLTSVSLASNQFTGSVPSGWGSLTTLKEIYVSRNPGITGSYPSEWGNLYNLDLLWTFQTSQRGSIPDSWKGMKSLQNIEADDVSGPLPSWLGSAWTQMDTFILTGRGNGALTGSLPDTICDMKALSVLWLFGNKLDGSFPSCVGQLSAITNIQLQDQKFTSPIPSQINMPNLKYLYWSNNGFTGSVPSGFGRSVHLSVLDLHQNSLTGALPEDLSTLKALLDLSLNGNKLAGPIPSTLQSWFVKHMSVWTCRLDDNPFKCPLPAWLPSDCYASCVNATTSFELKESWYQFKKHFGKIYASLEEETSRFEIFKMNLDQVNLLNQKNGETSFGITKFMDLSPMEFKSLYLSGYKPSSNFPNKEVSHSGRKLLSDIPDKMDWRDHGAVTPVKDQGQCGSCWAFSATEAIESGYFMAKKSLPVLSPQQIVSCDNKGHDFGCNGGWPYGAYEYLLKSGGIEAESDYPYTSGGGDSGTCKFDSSKIKVELRNYTFAVPPCQQGACDHQDEQLFAANVVASGPASVCVDATTWQFYSEGIVRNLETCPRDAASLDHCVELVGYDTDDSGKKYWIVRNSWNTNWGMKGYILLEMGQNLCGIANVATFVDF